MTNLHTSRQMRKLSWDEIERPDPETVATLPKHPVRLIVHNVRSIHNVGSMFRTSDAARIEHVHLTGFTGTPEHKDLHKTALGAQDTVEWSQHDEVEPLLDDLREAGYTIALLEQTDRTRPPAEVEADAFPLALVVGNEVRGIDEEVIDAADLALEIPQYGAKISLNVGVAYGIAVYDLIRRFRSLHGPPGEENRM
jgi:tRNA G18 (ribose-2'-O)-methylase SpoU